MTTMSHILRPLTRFGVETCSFASCLLGLLDCAMMGLLKDLLVEVLCFLFATIFSFVSFKKIKKIIIRPSFFFHLGEVGSEG
jgi:hypothetical protein